MNEADLQARVYEWLVSEKSYPRDELQFEVVIGSGIGNRTYRADIAIVDSKRSEIIALIEIKGVRNHKTLRDGVSQLLQYRRMLSKPHIPIYLFFPSLKDSNHDFEIAQVLSDVDTKDIYSDEFPSFDALITGDKTGKKASHSTAVKSAVDTFQITCIVLSLIVAIVLVLDIIGLLRLTSKQLILGAITVGLLLMPYAAKFKMLGVEFERHVPKNDDE